MQAWIEIHEEDLLLNWELAINYTSHADAVDKIFYYLIHTAERETIAQAGKARCLGEHNMTKRARAFLEIVRQELRRGQQ